MKMTPTAPFLFYLTLLVQTGLTEGSCEVENCSPDSCDGMNCTLCVDGYFKDTFAKCSKCYIFCKQCDQNQCFGCPHASCHGCIHNSCHNGCGTNNVYCSGCPDGYYKNFGSRCNRCFHSHCKCSLEYNCIECFPGKYGISNFCQNDCPDECVTCTSSIDCTECVPGKFGDTCKLNCTTTCQDGKCHKISGICFQGCTGNQYLDSDGKCKNCNTRCSGCVGFHNCTTCNKSYYWGSYCQYDCTGCSGDCEKDNGCRSGCMAKYYHHYNRAKQEYECTRCPETCKSCTSSVNCTNCEMGYWGAYCQHSCTGCSSECKKDSGCHSGCNARYFKNYNTVKQDYECLRCPNTCTNCTNSSYCIICENGYWGTYCQHNCTNCLSSCKKDEGCGQHCETGFYAQAIDNGYICKKCLENCKNCSSSNTCEECKQGYFAIDDKKCEMCPVTCNNSLCDTADGTCLDGCILGNTGYRCSGTCPQKCLECKQFDKSSCTGCEVSYFGDDCSSRCPNCQQSTCFQQNGTCTHGCVKGFTGSRCDKITDTKEVIKDLIETDMVEKDEAILILETPVNIANSDLKTDVLSNVPRGPKTKSTITLEEATDSTELSVVEKDKKNRDARSRDQSEVQESNDAIDKEGDTYYNTAGKRVPVSGLAEYIRNKDYNSTVEEFHKLPRGLLKDYSVAKNPRNASRNRYKLIYPYDESRVILKDGGNDYVNASFIEGHNRTKEYIGSSGPFKRENSTNETIPDFWRMVWQERCETIVMLTKCYENGEHKCEQYWPELGKSSKFAKLKVTCVTEDEYADFTIRSFLVTKDSETLNTHHLQFTAWPDKGIPADVTSMIEYRQKVRSLHKGKTCPMIVHCSAGIGRTGTFIALDLLTFKGEVQGYVDIFRCVTDLRSQRTNLVQTPEQYEYLHHAVLHALTFDCQSITAEKFIETYSKYVKKKDGKSHIETQFQNLQSTLGEMSVDEKSAKDRNGSLPDKNREGADIPGDENRIRLSGIRKPGASDYINAVFINGFRTQNRFIVAQTPLPTTVVDFLTMICQFKCSCVVMMEETDLEDKTVGVFWPADNQAIKHGVFQVRCKESKTTETYTIKKLSLIQQEGKKETESEIDLFIFTNWPKDAAVPKSSDSLIQLINDVDKKSYHPKEARPILIHCMTGGSRSCLYCAVSVLIEKLEIEHEVSVVNTVRQIKARRRSGIPTLDQYKFCHQAVISYLQTFDIYSNFGLKSSQSAETASK